MSTNPLGNRLSNKIRDIETIFYQIISDLQHEIVTKEAAPYRRSETLATSVDEENKY